MGVERYREMRLIALERIQNAAMSPGAYFEREDLRLTLIDAAAVVGHRSWLNRRVNWDWGQISRDFRSKQKRFELAAWVGARLEGLAIGAASDGDENVTLPLSSGIPRKTVT